MPEKEMNQNQLPPGWDAKRVRRVLDHYEGQSEEEAAAEDEAAFEHTELREAMRSLSRQNDNSSQWRGERALALLRGSATAEMTTDEILGLTRGDTVGGSGRSWRS
jgi:hypothetical protein